MQVSFAPIVVLSYKVLQDMNEIRVEKIQKNETNYATKTNESTKKMMVVTTTSFNI